MISHVRRVMTSGAGSDDLLRARCQPWHIADREWLRIEDLLTPRDGSLLRSRGIILPWRVDGENIGSELFSSGITPQGIINAWIELLGRQELWSALRAVIRIQISRKEVVELSRVERQLEAYNLAQLRRSRGLCRLGIMAQRGIGCLLSQVCVEIGREGLLIVQRVEKRFPPVPHDRAEKAQARRGQRPAVDRGGLLALRVGRQGATVWVLNSRDRVLRQVRVEI